MSKGNDASIFVNENFEPENSIFASCIKLIVFSYLKLKKEKEIDKYSRSKILELIRKNRGSEKSLLELEDFLRNSLISDYAKKLKSTFDLTHVNIDLNVAELKDNVSIGSIDIKVTPLSLTDDAYFIFECKRLKNTSSSKKSYYEEGIERFVEEKYYPEVAIDIGGFIAFIEHDTASEKLESGSIETVLNDLINSHGSKNLEKKAESVSLVDANNKEVSSFKYVYCSKHKRKIKKDTITLYHLMLDYNDLISE